MTSLIQTKFTMQFIKNTPCTIVFGFLGSGKTTLVNQLLSLKSQSWGILINEFGKIGIDSKLVSDRAANAQNPTDYKLSKNSSFDINIKEVNGGCICCTSQLPLQISLSRLLAEHRPDHLIIEPTGLAHPKELIEQLNQPHWQTAINIKNIISVLNYNQWAHKKYQSHEGFKNHIKFSDLIIINRLPSCTNYQGNEHNQNTKQSITAKKNVYELDKINTLKEVTTPLEYSNDLEDIIAMIEWIDEINPDATLLFDNTNEEFLKTLSKKIDKKILNDLQYDTLLEDSALLSRKLQSEIKIPLSSLAPIQAKQSYQGHIINNTHDNKQSQHFDDSTHTSELPYRYHENQQDISVGGWRLSKDWTFKQQDMLDWLLSLNHWERIKGVINTDEGWKSINFTIDSIMTTSCTEQVENQLEIIFDNSNTSINDDFWSKLDVEIMQMVDV